MPSIDRRAFLTTTMGLAMGTALDQRQAVRPSDRPTINSVVLRGGVDGLSMIVPHGDPLYYRARPTLAVPSRDVIDLDGYFGLHPALAPLKKWWDNKSLAIIPAAGFPHQERSHLRAQRRLPADPVLDVGGWDTHVNQGARDGTFARRLHAFAAELDGLLCKLDERLDSGAVVTVSEFGRTIRENRNGGTDHGHATVMLVFGGSAPGGTVVGGWPGLEGPDVAVTTDCNHLFGGPLVSHTMP